MYDMITMTLKGFHFHVSSSLSRSVNRSKNDKFLLGCDPNARCKRKSVFDRKSRMLPVLILLISFGILMESHMGMVAASSTPAAAAAGGGGGAGEGKPTMDLQGKREDLFSSTSKLEDLVEHELQIVELLDTFVDYTMSRANIIKS